MLSRKMQQYGFCPVTVARGVNFKDEKSAFVTIDALLAPESGMFRGTVFGILLASEAERPSRTKAGVPAPSEKHFEEALRTAEKRFKEMFPQDSCGALVVVSADAFQRIHWIHWDEFVAWRTQWLSKNAMGARG